MSNIKITPAGLKRIKTTVKYDEMVISKGSIDFLCLGVRVGQTDVPLFDPSTDIMCVKGLDGKIKVESEL